MVRARSARVNVAWVAAVRSTAISGAATIIASRVASSRANASSASAAYPLARNADKFAGSELDFLVTYKPVKQLSLIVGFSHFFAGNYLEDTGASSDANFGYAQATLSF